MHIRAHGMAVCLMMVVCIAWQKRGERGGILVVYVGVSCIT